MADSLTIGKIYGIPIQLHWTFILILIIALYFGIFSFIVILFAIVLLHELAHSLTALHYKVKVKKIVLIPLGGASIIDLDEVKPELSFRIAAAGPLLNVVLTAIFGILYLYLPGGALGSFLYLVFLLNVLLAISNIAPAFPLDGGRVLKSYLEEKYDQLTATKKAVKVSQITLLVYLVVSTAYVFYLPSVSLSTLVLLLLWNLIIIMFIYGGAQSELASAYMEKYTVKLHARDAITKDYIEVTPNTTLRRLYGILLKRGTKTVLFKKNDSVMMVSGINANPMDKNSQKMLSKKVSDFGHEIPKMDYKDKLSRAVEKMKYEETGVVAVMHHGKISGILLAEHVESIVALHMQHSQPR